MKKCFVFLLISFVYVPRLLADDGAFNAYGNTIFPLHETVVQLKKEKLDLVKKGDTLYVNIYFEFYNPGPEKELLVGFVTPPAWNGMLSMNERNHPQIKEFTVNVNGSDLSYEVYRIDSSGFKIHDSTVRGNDFIYSFKTKFPHGKSIIKHSYSYLCGSGVYIDKSFYYRLTTGTLWANHEIEDFELNINMGKDVNFFLPYSFNRTKTNWRVVGVGKLSVDSISVDPERFFAGPAMRMAYMRSGYIQYKERHFKPANDLFFGIFASEIEFRKPGKIKRQK